MGYRLANPIISPLTDITVLRSLIIDLAAPLSGCRTQTANYSAHWPIGADVDSALLIGDAGDALYCHRQTD